jgi:hypothetical protein
MNAENLFGVKGVCTPFVMLSFLFSSLLAIPVGKFSYCCAPESLNGDTIAGSYDRCDYGTTFCFFHY